MVFLLFSFLSSFFSLYSSTAYAWQNHALGTAVALSSLPELKGRNPVVVEPLESFLRAEQKGLERLLSDEESWAQTHVPQYPPRPEELKFKGVSPGTGSSLKLSFLKAMRVNPEMKLPLFLQVVPGGLPQMTRPLISPEEVSIIPNSLPLAEKNRLISLREGDLVDAIGVIATGSDEPDYGLDIRLWEDNLGEDNPGNWGKAFHFGKQPFGNPVLEFSSQAPFHMGFFHEARLAYQTAGYLSRTYPEYRIHLFLSLARYALKTGHPYWAWRFTGWGLHYIQDLTQPYHATALPGVSLFRMLGLGALDLLGVHKPLIQQVQRVTDEHLALEDYQFRFLLKSLSLREENAVIMALKNPRKDSDYGPYTSRYPREVITLESHGLAKSTHGLLKKPQPLAMETWLADLLGHFGAHSRNFVRAVLKN